MKEAHKTVAVLGIVTSALSVSWGAFRFYQTYVDIWPPNYVKYGMIPWQHEYRLQALRGMAVHIITNVGALIAASRLLLRARHAKGVWLFFTTFVALQLVYVVGANLYYWRHRGIYKLEVLSVADLAQVVIPLIVCPVSWALLRGRAIGTPPNQAL